MTNQPKTLHQIEDKFTLNILYENQLPRDFIRAEINEIIRTNRNLEPTECVRSKHIRLKEALTFISVHGEPIGYTLSEDLKNKLKAIEVDG